MALLKEKASIRPWPLYSYVKQWNNRPDLFTILYEDAVLTSSSIPELAHFNLTDAQKTKLVEKIAKGASSRGKGELFFQLGQTKGFQELPISHQLVADAARKMDMDVLNHSRSYIAIISYSGDYWIDKPEALLFLEAKIRQEAFSGKTAGELPPNWKNVPALMKLCGGQPATEKCLRRAFARGETFGIPAEVRRQYPPRTSTVSGAFKCFMDGLRDRF